MNNVREFLNVYQYPDVVFDYINMLCIVDSGIPVFLIAPVGGAKSTIIKACVQYMKKTNFAVQLLERISPLRLLVIQDSINNCNALLASEDFSTIGEDESMTYKTVLLVSKLSYDKTYKDPLFKSNEHPTGLDITVKKLSFLCGMQPLWLSIYAQKEVWETIVAEKMLRYYRLPIDTIKNQEEQIKIINYLGTISFKHNKKYDISEESREILLASLLGQCANRAKEYVPKLCEAIKAYIPKEIIDEWIKYFAMRFEFENKIYMRYYEGEFAILPTTDILHKEYTVLFHTLQNNPLNTHMLSYLCKIRGRTQKLTRQHIYFLVKLATGVGFVLPIRLSREVKLLPSEEMQQYSIHKWDIIGDTFTEKEMNEDAEKEE